ncbi:MAG: histidinol dehydrogenase [Proteobacteria bacterium]|nr:histidinol dehydrogenase [Pseudomonadota bacterium]
MAIRIIKTSDSHFDALFAEILKRGEDDAGNVDGIVTEILLNVKKRGDAALLEYTARFDNFTTTSEKLKVSEDEIEEAFNAIESDVKKALTIAAERIRTFHEKQLEESWASEDEEGIILGQLVRPLEKVGIYVPGGKAAYPSSVLMNTIPARVAGVKQVIMVVPTPGGEKNKYLLAAAKIAGVDAVYPVGGAQAVAALAYGTETIPNVDKIVGPGNIFVATAKKMVFGVVDIDMIAGPSEVLIISDGSGEPSYIAADMLAQAEHDEMASSTLITTSEEFGRRVSDELSRQVEKLKRRDIAKASIDNRGVIIIANTLEEAFNLSNDMAPEHLELALDEPEKHLEKVNNAGAIFMGHYTPEALGDYVAGPNHVLPTGGSAKFFSPLGTYDFLKRSSLLSFTKEAFSKIGREAELIADVEGLEGHGNTVRIRMGEAI